MTPYALSITTGKIKAGQYEYLWVPNRITSDTGLVLCHGSGQPYEYALLGNTGSNQIPAWAAWSGIPCVAAEMDDQAWGDDTAMADVDAAINYMAATTGVRSDKVLMLGASMGGYTAIRYTLNNPSKVAAVVGIIPLTNIVGFYNNNVGGAQTQIASAWGVTAPNPLPAAADVQSQAANLTVPAQLYYSSADTLIQPADTQAFAAAANIPATNVGTQGHSEGTIADAVNQGGGQLGAILSFFNQHITRTGA